MESVSRVRCHHPEGHPLAATISHPRAISVRFDDPNLVSCAGLVMALATRCGLSELVPDRLSVAGKGAANAAAKMSSGTDVGQVL